MTTTLETDTAIDIAVFTGAPGHSIYKTISRILELPVYLRIHILVHKPRKQASRLFRSQIRNIRRHGWRWIPYQSAEILALLISKVRKKSSSSIQTGMRYTLESLLQTGNVAIREFPTINDEAAVAYLATLPNLQLGLSLAAPILKASTFETPHLGTLNLHKGKLPKFRGMPPAFWEISADETEVGVSVHFVEKSLDTGAIVKAGTVPIEEYSSPAGLRVALDELGHKLVCSAVRDVLADTVVAIPQEGVGHTNTRPTLKAEWAMSRSLARKAGANGIKRGLKNVAMETYCAFRHLGRSLSIVKPTITVLLYHRVSDALRDSVTVGIEQFDTQLTYLRNNCDVRSLRSLLEGNVSTTDGRSIICITFDDGYLDNYSNAAPLLLKHGLPATFFVSTDKISNQTPFQHDINKLGYGLPNMTWDNIREMATDGFEFGSHTINHTDLGSASEQVILRELAYSKQTLENELGNNSTPFAFPFGRKINFSERARNLVKDAGYTCCCSGFGGHNSAQNWDRFSIKRIGISYGFSLAAFRARVHGWNDA